MSKINNLRVKYQCKECGANHYIILNVEDDKLGGGWNITDIHEWVVSPDIENEITKDMETAIAEAMFGRLSGS
jgi:hypothetical protein